MPNPHRRIDSLTALLRAYPQPDTGRVQLLTTLVDKLMLYDTRTVYDKLQINSRAELLRRPPRVAGAGGVAAGCCLGLVGRGGLALAWNPTPSYPYPMLLPMLLAPDAAPAPLRRLRPTAAQLAEFRGHLGELLRHLDPTKIERHGETHILDFLRLVTRPAEGGGRYGNVNGKRDLVLHLGDTAASPVAVVLEVKGPTNPKEMLAAQAADPAADTRAAKAAVGAAVAALYGVALPAAT